MKDSGAGDGKAVVRGAKVRRARRETEIVEPHCAERARIRSPSEGARAQLLDGSPRPPELVCTRRSVSGSSLSRQETSSTHLERLQREVVPSIHLVAVCRPAVAYRARKVQSRASDLLPRQLRSPKANLQSVLVSCKARARAENELSAPVLCVLESERGLRSTGEREEDE